MSSPLDRTARALASLWSHPAHSYLGVPCRIWVGLVFIAAAWHKILDPGAFAFSIAAYQVLPLEYINVLAIILPWLEIVAAVTLVSGLWTRASALCMVGMNVMFIVALVMAIRSQVQMTSCGCFAADAEATMKTIGWDYVYRDIGYLVASLYVALFDGGRIGLDGLLAARRRKHAAKTQ
jgi:uncharacterized membrane protein YphA (DoxX/SURF4 family)